MDAAQALVSQLSSVEERAGSYVDQVLQHTSSSTPSSELLARLHRAVEIFHKIENSLSRLEPLLRASGSTVSSLKSPVMKPLDAMVPHESVLEVLR